VSDEELSRSGLEEALRAPVRAVLGGPSRALTSAVAERVAEILIEEGVVERTVERALQDPGTERAAVAVLDSELLDEVVERLLKSEEMQQIIERIATAPEVRSAITKQGVGLLDDLRRELTKQAQRLDLVVERPWRRLFRRRPRERSPAFAGVVTRAIAIGLDAALFNVVLLGLSALVAVLANALTDNNPGTAQTVLAGATAWSIGASIYLTAFWTLTGQTPGMRFMGIELEGAAGGHINVGRSVRRLVGMVLGALLFFTGYFAILVNERRRGMQDKFADTVVVYKQVERPALPRASSSLSSR
jgi:uncharacterized RDD family membrane protein YckC